MHCRHVKHKVVVVLHSQAVVCSKFLATMETGKGYTVDQPRQGSTLHHMVLVKKMVLVEALEYLTKQAAEHTCNAWQSKHRISRRPPQPY